jgi:tRNA(Ile)-lysidine synthase
MTQAGVMLLPQPGPPRPVLAGFSGGLDSSVLLQLLAATPSAHAGLRAIHVHHGLQPQADAWAVHCEETCAALGVPLQVVRVEIPRDSGLGPEGAARAARHAAFAAALQDDEVLALAHHRDDQAETFLLRALRASGPDGLAAMPAWRRHGRGWLWRPLLVSSRDDLLVYAQALGLHWIEDPSNAGIAPDRNFLRHEVLPLLQRRWPRAGAALARSAGLCAEAAGLLEAQDAQALADVAGATPDTLDASGLLALPAPRRARALRRWIATLGLPSLPASGLVAIESELLPAAADAQAQFAWSGAVVRHWRGLLHAGMQRPPLPEGWVCEWDGAAPLALPGGGTLQLHGVARFEAPLRAHARRGGERMVLPGRDHAHTLKHVLQDLGVPPWLRERLPLLSSADGAVLAAADLAISAPLDAWLRAHHASIAWTP